MYNGVPEYVAATRSLLGVPHTYSVPVMTSMPVYALLTDKDDFDQAVAYNTADQIPRNNYDARSILEQTNVRSWYPSTDGGGYSLVSAELHAETSMWDQAIGWRASDVLYGTPGDVDVIPEPAAAIVFVFVSALGWALFCNKKRER